MFRKCETELSTSGFGSFTIFTGYDLIPIFDLGLNQTGNFPLNKIRLSPLDVISYMLKTFYAIFERQRIFFKSTLHICSSRLVGTFKWIDLKRYIRIFQAHGYNLIIIARYVHSKWHLYVKGLVFHNAFV